MSSVNMKWYQSEINLIRRNFMRGMVKMGYGMANRAKTNAPYLSGALRLSIRVDESSSNAVWVRAGGQSDRFQIDYAELREFNNRKNPQTKYYMTRAYNSVVAGDITQYFKDIVK